MPSTLLLLGLIKILKEKLLTEGRKPYVIPVGGSNSLGTWGYIEAIREVERQLQHSSSERKFDDIVVACGVSSRDIVSIHNAKGLGYAMSTAEELKFVKQVAEATGVILDPVYSGKAAYGMMKDMSENPSMWEGRKVLFIHTGGLLGLYDKADEMASLMGKWRKMHINESIPRQDGKMF